MTVEQLQAIGIDVKWLQPLEDTFAKYDMNTPTRQACFIGQCAHESNNFKTLEENLNYSAEGLMRTWSSRFPTLDVAEQYARNPEKIANKVYGGRAELGNIEEGDGWKFHGRGIIQLTGRSNYTVCGQALVRPFANTPELVLEPENACLSAGWFWNKKSLNSLADIGDIDTMTRRINGGLIGLQDRKAKIAKAESILSV